MSNISQALLYQQLELFQLQRHDYLNHFQVIRGYLQLDMPGKALAYIDEALASLTPQQELSRMGQKELRAALLGFYFGLHKKGIIATVQFPAEMKEEGFWQHRWKEEYLEGLVGHTKEWLQDIPADLNTERTQAKLELRTTVEGFSCHLTLSDQEHFQLKKVWTTEK